ncbi:MAG: hypothetical protein AB7K64_11230 [Variibacter sp.]
MGLLIAAAVTSGLALIVIGGVTLTLAEARERRVLILALVIALPLQPLVFAAVRLPLLHAFLPDASAGWIRPAFLLPLAPLTEEPAKWLVLLVPAVRRLLSRKSAVPLALAIGLGFGIGEIWFVAHAAMTAPGFIERPFWMYGGFAFERLQVCFLHGAFVAPPLATWAWGRSFLPGGIAGMAGHFLLNFPIYLAGIDLFGLGRPVWVTILLMWVPLWVILCGVALRQIRRAGVAAESAIAENAESAT